MLSPHPIAVDFRDVAALHASLTRLRVSHVFLTLPASDDDAARLRWDLVTRCGTMLYRNDAARLVDSVLLGAIVEAYAASIRHGGGLKLLHVSQRFRQLLTITKLDGVLTSFESEDAAVKSFSRSNDGHGKPGGASD